MKKRNKQVQLQKNINARVALQQKRKEEKHQ
jgi:hypothetical protein